MMVNPSVPAITVPEFIAYAKFNPGKLSMASSGAGSPLHLAGELFKAMTAIDMVHVPYRGEGPALAELIGGQVQVLFGTPPASLSHIRSGTVRALAVTTDGRSEVLPGIPSVGEFVPGYGAGAFYGLGAPKNTHPDIIDRLNKEVNAALADPTIKARLTDLGGVPMPMTPADFGRLIADETQKWSRVVKFSGAKPD